MNNIFYYKKDGEQFGPHSVQELRDLVLEGSIHSDTPVSRDEQSWKPAKKEDWFTEIKPDLKSTDLAKQALKLDWAPILKAAVPTSALLFPLIALQIFSPVNYGAGLAFLTYYAGAVFLTYAMYVIDCSKKSSEGYRIPPRWTILLTPAYFWYRAKYLKNPQIGYIGGWLGAVVVMLVLVYGAGPWTLQSHAVEVVDKILINNSHTQNVTCEHLELIKEHVEGRYEAKVLLSNGTTKRAAVLVKENGFVVVHIFGL